MKEKIEVRKPKEEELNDLIPIYKKVFKVHNILQAEEPRVKEYLLNKYKEETDLGFLVAIKDGKVAGGLLLRKVGGDEKHWNIRLNHFATDDSFKGQGIGTALLNSVDEIVLDKKGDRSVKIEIHVSENEKDAVEFFKKFGYNVEGKVKSHFRNGELVYFLGKEID